MGTIGAWSTDGWNCPSVRTTDGLTTSRIEPNIMSQEYVVYCDESGKKGRYYSNFYGGILIRSKDLDDCRARMEACASRVGLTSEIKWQKVTDQYLPRYCELMHAFFDEVAADRIKTRIMFTQNALVPTELTPMQVEMEFFLLYYQFIRKAFGLRFSNCGSSDIRLRLLMDQLPDNREKCDQFRGYLAALNRNEEFQSARIRLAVHDVGEVDSKHHVLLQCLDVVLGSMYFRLNDLHQEKPDGASRRGKRTIAKEKLYKLILQRIRQIYPNFNIGASTGKQGNPANHWNHPYRHWKFVPSQHRRDSSRYKPK